MHDRIEPLDVFRGQLSDVLADGEGPWPLIVEEPAVPVIAAIDADDIQSALQKSRGEDGTDIAVGSGDQYLHCLVTLALPGGLTHPRKSGHYPGQYRIA